MQAEFLYIFYSCNIRIILLPPIKGVTSSVWKLYLNYYYGIELVEVSDVDNVKC